MDRKQEVLENLNRVIFKYSKLLYEEGYNEEYVDLFTKAVLVKNIIDQKDVNVIKDNDLAISGIFAKEGLVTIRLGKLYNLVKNNNKDLINLLAHEVKHLINGDISDETKERIEDIIDYVADVKAKELKNKYGIDVNKDTLKQVLKPIADNYYNILADVDINSELGIKQVGNVSALTYENVGPFILKEGELVIHSKLSKLRELLLKIGFEIGPGGFQEKGIPIDIFDKVEIGGITKEKINDIVNKVAVKTKNEIAKSEGLDNKVIEKSFDKVDKITNTKPLQSSFDFNYNRIVKFIESAESQYSYEGTYIRFRYGAPVRIPTTYYACGVLVDTLGSVNDILEDFAGVLLRLSRSISYKLIVGVFSSYNDYYIFEVEPSATKSFIANKFKAFLGGKEILGVWREMFRKYKLKHYIILSDFEFYDEEDVIEFVKENNFKVLAIVNNDTYQRRADYIEKITDNIITYE